MSMSGWYALGKGFAAGGGGGETGGGGGEAGGGGREAGGGGTPALASAFQHWGAGGGTGGRGRKMGRRKTGGKAGGHRTGGDTTGGRKTGTAKSKGTLAPAAGGGVEVRRKEGVGAILAEEYGSFEFESSESATDPGPLKRKRKDNHLGRIGKVDKNQKARDEMKELKERARLEQIADLKEKVGDPFDSLDFVLTKRMAVWLYLSLSEELGENVYDLVGDIVDHTRRWVYETVEEFKEEGGFCDSKSGKTFRLASPIQDQTFRLKFCQYVKDNASPNGAKNLTSDDLTDWVNSELGMTGDNQFKSRTIRFKRYF